MIISVIVPTYCRPQDLRRCMTALTSQTRKAEEILVIARDSDQETRAVFEDFFQRTELPLRLVNVSIAGQVAALNAGLDTAKGEIIAVIDDDTAPCEDWLQRMEAHFAANPRVGGVGGRDWQPIERGSRKIVGKVQWFGRVIGNHHLGVGEPREVDILKGANMGWRHSAIENIRFDERLRGAGVQQHNDMAFSLAVKQAGWMLIYDPKVAIDHYPAARIGEGQHHRGFFNPNEQQNSVYNETLTLLGYLSPFRRTAFLLWAYLLGSRGEPGAGQIPRLILMRERHVWPRIRATYKGRAAAIQTFTSEQKQSARKK